MSNRDNGDIRLKQLAELSAEQIYLLCEKFSVHKFYVQSALSMTIIHHLGYESKAKNIREARTEYHRSDDNSEMQRASVRKIIEFALCEEDIMEAFYLSNNVVESKMCVRKLAEILFKEQPETASVS